MTEKGPGMGLFKTKKDPFQKRERQLKSQIQALEARIQELSEAKERKRVERAPFGYAAKSPAASPRRQDKAHEPVFEEFKGAKPRAPEELANTPSHYNELGLRKYDLIAAWRRLVQHFKGPETNNAKLVNFLAAGSIQGLHPLRYEKRVARNRFLFLFVLLLLISWGLFYFYIRNR